LQDERRSLPAGAQGGIARIERRRGHVLDDQPPDPFGTVLGDEHGDVATQRVTEQVDLLDPLLGVQAVEEGEDVIAHRGAPVVTCPRAAAVPPQVERHHPTPRTRGSSGEPVPGRAAARHPVQGEHGWPDEWNARRRGGLPPRQ